jgi:hypothetical protein
MSKKTVTETQKIQEDIIKINASINEINRNLSLLTAEMIEIKNNNKLSKQDKSGFTTIIQKSSKYLNSAIWIIFWCICAVMTLNKEVLAKTIIEHFVN